MKRYFVWILAGMLMLSVAVLLMDVRAQAPQIEQIYFRSDRDGNWEVYIMDTDGNNQRNLTNNPANDWAAGCSPDGKMIAFHSDRDGNWEVYIMDTDGNNQRRLTNNPADDLYPVWSPDGKMIAFTSNRDGNDEVYVMDADGNNQRRLTNNPADDHGSAWSPDGKMIAFASNRDGNGEIYVMDADGNNQRNLTNNPGGDGSPVWSPDGKMIAFNSHRDGNWEVYVMDADGNNQRNLTNNPPLDGGPVWSPDGKMIAFHSNRDGGNYEIYVMDADGNNPRRLTNNPAIDDWPRWFETAFALPPAQPDISLSEQQHNFGDVLVGNYADWNLIISNVGNAPLTLNSITSDNPAFTIVSPTFPQNISPGNSLNVIVSFSPTSEGSHTGTLTVSSNDPDEPGVNISVSGIGIKPELTFAQIAFTSHRDGNYEIYVMDADGNNPRNLTNNPAWDESPAWSPDGQKIVFISDRDGNGEIFVMDADGNNPRNLTNHPAEDLYLAWSPDGQKIAFESYRDGNGEIYVMDADGNNPRNLTNHPARDTHPAWSPDGQKIAFCSDRDGNVEIYVMDADGGNQSRLTNNLAWDGLPAWSPDGQKIAFVSERDWNYEIYVMFADGGNQSRLTYNWFPPVADWCPAWSPDGQKIAFASERDGNYEIYVMDADGNNPRNLTNHPARDLYPAWFDPAFALPPAQPDISLSEQKHNFGDVLVGNYADWNLIVTNEGKATLTMNSITPPDSSPFTIISPSFPQSILPGNSLDVIVRFSPTSERPYTGTLTITSNDPDEPAVLVYLEGSGVLENHPPSQPTNISPPNGAIVVTLTPTLESSLFSDPDPGDIHTASHWLIWDVTNTGGDNDLILPFFDRIDTQSLTHIDIPPGILEGAQTYSWCVQYQDNHEAWSEYSEATSFTTAKILSVPYYDQGDTKWCAPTSMSMILKYYKPSRNIQQWDIAECLNLGRDDALNRTEEEEKSKIVEFFRVHDLATKVISDAKDLGEIMAWIDKGCPVLLVLHSKIPWLNHAVVIVGYSFTATSEKFVYINDSGGSLINQKMRLGVSPPIAVEARWSDIVEYIGTASYLVAVDGEREIQDAKGTIDLDAGYDGFYFKDKETTYRVHSWFYGLDKGLIWKPEASPSLGDLRPLALSEKDLFRLGRYITNHTNSEQTYGLEIKFLGSSSPEPCRVNFNVKGVGSGENRVSSDQIMSPRSLQDILKDEYGKYIVTLTLFDETFTVKYDEIIFPSIEYKSLTEFTLSSPVDLYVTDPEGLHVGFNSSTREVVNEILGAVYTGPGSEPQIIAIPGRKMGNYLVNVIPHLDVSPTDTYNLKVWADGTSIVLADNVQISDIPSQPYIVKSTDTTITANPIANAGHDQKIIVGETLQFDGSKSYDPDGTIISCQWDFGDGAIVPGTTVSHIYIIAGTYIVTLTVTDNSNATGTDTAIVTVLTPAEAIDELITIVESMNLQKGINNSLDAKLQAARDSLLAANAGNRNDATNKLQAFINAVQAQREEELTNEQADQLVNYANRIIKALGAVAAPPEGPKEFKLAQNYPNPFNPDTWIPYQLAEDADVTIRIYDVAGHLIRTLDLGHRPAGFYTTKDKAAYWDGQNDAGEPVASGVYLYTIQAGEFTATHKMLMLK